MHILISVLYAALLTLQYEDGSIYLNLFNREFYISQLSGFIETQEFLANSRIKFY